ncbi:hypothetical protein [Corynebacterium tuberculostearicum]|uniref:hypothetical protein n=1 Tax=Corynebacterium tuberculostearicum TaxID=38304 RepID=UPI00265D2799|nr:hypothetical protein [Corynebacterium tuberculostearicum]
MASVVVLMGGVFLAVRVAVGLDGILFFFGGAEQETMVIAAAERTVQRLSV